MTTTAKKERAPAPPSIRTTLNEQFQKLQAKHTSEVDFLEDLRSFSKQRSALEKEYAQNLQRLTQQFLTKKTIRPPPELPNYQRTENRGILEIWKQLLEKTEEAAKSHLTVSELLLSQVTEVARQQKRIKEQAFKRYIDVAQKMNTEIQESVKEMTTTKKSYTDQEKVCADSRQKFSEAESRLRRGDTKFFESASSLEKTHKKNADRLKSCQKRLTVGRNDYLLAVTTTNTHLNRHATRDLPNLMQAMDGEMYLKVRDAYTAYAQVQADSANIIKAEFEDLRDQAALVNREYVLECFLDGHPVLKKTTVYSFETAGQDTVSGLSREHGAEIFLDKDARKWSKKLADMNKAIADKQRSVKGLQSVTQAYTKNPEFGTPDAQAEAIQQTETLQEEVRQLQVQTTKATARLDILSEAGVDVSKWLQKASGGEQQDKTSVEHLSVGSHPGSLSLNQFNSGSQDFEWLETASLRSGLESDIMSLCSNRSDMPKYCIALYDYKSQRTDELDICTNEELEVMEWDDGDGWCKGRNKSGQEGYFPQNYVQPSSRSNSPPTLQQDGVTNGNAPALSTSSSNEATGMYLQAQYEYTAQFDEELSFPEGAIIELMRTDDNGVDDGWWQGRYEGKVGVFPSVVVEVVTNGVDHSGSFDGLTPMNSFASDVPPPPDSPPPLPPDYPPPGIFPEDLGIAALGPIPVPMQDSAPELSSPSLSPEKLKGNFPQDSSSPLALKSRGTPRLTVEMVTPGPKSKPFSYRDWRLDSFDDYDGDESIV